jgi:hypothetical protein
MLMAVTIKIFGYTKFIYIFFLYKTIIMSYTIGEKK